jgi:tetratricopeptide (TPR) repeat protein
LQKAVSALRQAASFPPPEISMRDLGDTFMDLGQALNALAAISTQDNGAEHLQQAAEAFRNALQRYQTGQVAAGQFSDERIRALCSLAQADSDYLDRIKTVGAGGTRTEAINSYEKALETYKPTEGQEIRVALAEQYFKRSKELPGPTGNMACDDVRHAQQFVSHALRYAATRNDPNLLKRANKLQRDCVERATALGCAPNQGK